MSKNLTDIVDGFLLFLSRFTQNAFVTAFEYHSWTKLIGACIARLTGGMLVRV